MRDIEMSYWKTKQTDSEQLKAIRVQLDPRGALGYQDSKYEIVYCLTTIDAHVETIARLSKVISEQESYIRSVERKLEKHRPVVCELSNCENHFAYTVKSEERGWTTYEKESDCEDRTRFLHLNRGRRVRCTYEVLP